MYMLKRLDSSFVYLYRCFFYGYYLYFVKFAVFTVSWCCAWGELFCVNVVFFSLAISNMRRKPQPKQLQLHNSKYIIMKFTVIFFGNQTNEMWRAKKITTHSHKQQTNRIADYFLFCFASLVKVFRMICKLDAKTNSKHTKYKNRVPFCI